MTNKIPNLNFQKYFIFLLKTEELELFYPVAI